MHDIIKMLADSNKSNREETTRILERIVENETRRIQNETRKIDEIKKIKNGIFVAVLLLALIFLSM